METHAKAKSPNINIENVCATDRCTYTRRDSGVGHGDRRFRGSVAWAIVPNRATDSRKSPANRQANALENAALSIFRVFPVCFANLSACASALPPLISAGRAARLSVFVWVRAATGGAAPDSGQLERIN